MPSLTSPQAHGETQKQITCLSFVNFSVSQDSNVVGYQQQRLKTAAEARLLGDHDSWRLLGFRPALSGDRPALRSEAHCPSGLLSLPEEQLSPVLNH